jgi:predicted house-cleaning noncanonical NTP pyrophosphatase (MazG superfamily)
MSIVPLDSNQALMSNHRVSAVVINASTKAVVETINADVRQIGQKAVGLTQIPKCWVPKWLSVPLETCNAAVLSEIQWLDIAKALISELSEAEELIVRSSAPNEGLDTRGCFESEKCSSNTPEQLAQVLRKISLQVEGEASNPELSLPQSPVCAPIVQIFLPASLLGHLSNEYRHAQRNVDFLYEVEQMLHPISGIETADPRSFRLDRPVQSVDVSKRIYVGTSKSTFENGIQALGRWIASQKLRAHFEWLVFRDEIYVVQLDTDPLPPKIKPMSQCPSTGDSSLVKGLNFFVRLQSDEKHSNLRKTRSHYLLEKANAFVPPIYIAENLHTLDWSEELPQTIAADLLKLCSSQLILRFDVPCNRLDWTNLPTIGPSIDPTEIGKKVFDATQNLVDKGIPYSDITLVAHHFIAARASAWSEARPDFDKVRVDAVWGLPDGLQTFAHDTYIWDLSKNTFKPNARYKDRFIDVAGNGQWITRRAYPKLARDWCCDKDSIAQIAQLTSNVAQQCSGPVRIMWFLDVIAGAGGKNQSLMPWIVVEPDANNQDSWGRPESWLEHNRDTSKFRKKAKLATSKFVSNKESLELFEKNPLTFDLGGRLVLFQPDETVVRDKGFLEKFSQVVKSNSNPSWSVLYEGSMLAHNSYLLRKFGIDVIFLSDQFQTPRRIYSRKLVRDLIPEKITQGGEFAEVKELNDEDYSYALRQKLVEEALEVAYADEHDDVIEELADVVAILKALASSMGSSWDEVIEVELKKRKQRGGFENRLYLEASGYNSAKIGDSSVPGEILVSKLRRGHGVCIPLVPPLRNDHAESRHTFSSEGIEILVTYKGHEVEVQFKRSKNWKQLSLFDENS